MKTSTRLLLIIYVVFTVGTFFLASNIWEGIHITDTSITFNFDTLGTIGIMLLAINTILGFVLYAKFLRSLSLSKGLFFSTLPVTLLFAVLIYSVAMVKSYDVTSAIFVRNVLAISETNSSEILWASLLFATYVIFLFLTFVFLTKPLNRVQRAVKKLGEGNVIGKKIELKGGEQFKDIGSSLNKINNNYKEKNGQRDRLLEYKMKFEEGVKLYEQGEYRKAKTVFESLLKDTKKDEGLYAYYNRCIDKLTSAKQ